MDFHLSRLLAWLLGKLEVVVGEVHFCGIACPRDDARAGAKSCKVPRARGDAGKDAATAASIINEAAYKSTAYAVQEVACDVVLLELARKQHFMPQCMHNVVAVV